MEELLRKLKIQRPPQGLREKALAAAKAELLRAEGERSIVDRVWESRAFWIATAATILVCVLANVASRTAATRRVTLETQPAVLPLAKDLAGMLGDGPVLERRFSAQLSATGATGPTYRVLANLKETYQ